MRRKFMEADIRCCWVLMYSTPTAASTTAHDNTNLSPRNWAGYDNKVVIATTDNDFTYIVRQSNTSISSSTWMALSMAEKRSSISTTHGVIGIRNNWNPRVKWG